MQEKSPGTTGRFWLQFGLLMVGLTLLTSCSLFRETVVEAQPSTPTLVPVTPISQPNPTIRLAPQRGEANTVVTVEGAGWPANQSITIYLESPTNPALTRKSVAVIGTKVDGTFLISFTYPDQSGWNMLNGVLVTVEETGNVQGARTSAAFLVNPAAPTPIPTLVIPPAAPATPVPVAVAPIVTSAALNMRQGPGTGYPVLTLLYRGTAFSVVGQDQSGSWLFIRLGNGTQGWVARGFTNFADRSPIIASPVAPIATATSTPLPTPVVIADWRGDYWTNRDMQGSPRLTRNDLNLDFNWGNGSPDSMIPSDNFSARWSRRLDFGQGTYRFYAIVDDGVRLWVDGQLIIDHWYDSSLHRVSGDISLAGGAHDLRIDYYDHSGEARIQVWWERLASSSYPNWKGEYWPNQHLRDNPIFSRDDRSIDFDWGENAPAPNMPADKFSVRWSRWVDFPGGLYRFRARSDDGIRFYLDGNLVLDKWQDGDGRNTYTVNLNLTGSHFVVVEYYENRGQAHARFWWERIDDPATATPLPTNTPLPTGTPLPTNTPTSTPLSTNTPTSTPLPTNTPVPTNTPTSTPPPTDTPTATPTPTVTATATICPQATPEPLWVDPVISPTDQLSQTVRVYLGSGEMVTIMAESGTFTAAGNFDAISNPAIVEVTLLPDTTHNLTVTGSVKMSMVNGCSYGGYTLSTRLDRHGQSLVIVQQTGN